LRRIGNKKIVGCAPWVSRGGGGVATGLLPTLDADASRDDCPARRFAYSHDGTR